MTDFRDPQGASLRLSNSERDEAVAELNANLRDGRLSEAEFTERSSTVRTAVTRGDVGVVLADLPPLGAGSPSAPPAAPFAPSLAKTPPEPIPSPGEARKGPLGGSAGVVATSISPFVALILFFLTGALVSWNYSWLWFLLVPLTWLVVYGAGTRDRTRRDR